MPKLKPEHTQQKIELSKKDGKSSALENPSENKGVAAFLANAVIPNAGSLGGPNAMVKMAAPIKSQLKIEASLPKRPIKELLSLYEKRRIEFEKFKSNSSDLGGDPLGHEAIQRAIRRMSYDYQQKEEEL